MDRMAGRVVAALLCWVLRGDEVLDRTSVFPDSAYTLALLMRLMFSERHGMGSRRLHNMCLPCTSPPPGREMQFHGGLRATEFYPRWGPTDYRYASRPSPIYFQFPSFQIGFVECPGGQRDRNNGKYL